MQSYFKRTMLLAAALLLTAGAWAQKTHTGYYLYHGKRVEVPVNSEVALAYFRTAQMDTATIHRNYQCLKEVALAADKADTLYACEVQLPEGDYAEGVAWLKAQPEVWDVEPVIGTTERVPVSNMFFVKLREQGDASLLAEAAAQVGARHEGPVLPGDLWHIVTVDKQSAGDAMSLSTQLGESGKFADVDPGFIFKVETYDDDCVSDSSFNSQWGMAAIHACDAWTTTTGSSIVKVSVIDQGVDISHREYNSTNVTFSYDVYNEGSPATIWGKHGTHVGGIIFANHSDYQIAGLAPGCSLINISDPMADNSDEMFLLRMYDAFWKAYTNGADIVNCSWGLHVFPTGANFAAAILEDAITNFITNGRSGKGGVVVFAAGNYREYEPSSVSYPASAIDEIIVVGSVLPSMTRSTFSCYGPELDIVAPGSSIYSTILNNQYENNSGTSMAAPHVAGVVALMLSANPNLTRKQVDRILKGTAQKVGNYTYNYTSTQPVGSWNTEVGHGLVDAAAAVAQAAATPAYDVMIKDAIDDTGDEPNINSVPINASPYIHAYPSGSNTEAYEFSYNGAYTLSAEIFNPSNCTVTLSNNDVKFYWTVLGNKLWKNSWTNGGFTCLFPNSGILNSNNIGPISILPNSSSTVSTTITVPSYEGLFCSPLNKPSSMAIVVVIDDDNITIGENASDYPLEAFVRINNNAAWRTYTISDNNIHPGYLSGNGSGSSIIALSPNPTTGMATLEYSLPEDVRTNEVIVMNSMGVEVYRAPATGQSHVIDLSNAPSGNYYVYLVWNGELLGMRNLIRN